jgi:hypothetical protein
VLKLVVEMSSWNHIIEARIRDWQERRRQGLITPPPPKVNTSLEAQLFDEVITLLRAANAAEGDEEREWMEKRAEEMKLRLLVLYEKYKRPMLARTLSERISAELQATAV